MNLPVKLMGAGALISVPTLPDSNDGRLPIVATHEFDLTEMGEWLAERNVRYFVLVRPDANAGAGDETDQFDTYIFIHDRVQAIHFLLQFGGQEYHRQWWDEQFDGEDWSPGLGWVKANTMGVGYQKGG